MLNVKISNEHATKGDGKRVLVDRIWPRGVSKEEAAIDWWAKEVAPSTELRKWFGHDPQRYDEFARRYRQELKGNQQLQQLKEMVAAGDVTLVYSAKDEQHNQARVLQQLLSA
jgi:uncharacterized protein YeaO (DUF488 family)